MEPLHVKDLSGVDLFVGDRCVMWRPHSLDTVRLVKYNGKTKMIGVEIERPVGGVWTRQRFSTPYQASKFYKI